MKKSILLIVSVLLFTGCAHLKSRVPTEAMMGDKVIYMSDIQTLPKTILVCPTIIMPRLGPGTNQMSAQGLSPEIIAEMIEAVVAATKEATKEYFNFRSNMAYVDREILIRGYDTNDLAPIIKDLMQLPAVSILTKCPQTGQFQPHQL